MVEHANRGLARGGTDGHMYETTQLGQPQFGSKRLVEAAWRNASLH
jgi:hypothetical protein